MGDSFCSGFIIWPPSGRATGSAFSQLQYTLSWADVQISGHCTVQGSLTRECHQSRHEVSPETQLSCFHCMKLSHHSKMYTFMLSLQSCFLCYFYTLIDCWLFCSEKCIGYVILKNFRLTGSMEGNITKT